MDHGSGSGAWLQSWQWQRQWRRQRRRWYDTIYCLNLRDRKRRGERVGACRGAAKTTARALEIERIVRMHLATRRHQCLQAFCIGGRIVVRLGLWEVGWVGQIRLRVGTAVELRADSVEPPLGRVPVVFDGVVGSARDIFCDLGPLVPVQSVCLGVCMYGDVLKWGRDERAGAGRMNEWMNGLSRVELELT